MEFCIKDEQVWAYLDATDEAAAWMLAYRRQADSEARGLLDRYGATGGVMTHYIGARGEIAVAAYLGTAMCMDVGVFSSIADVGDDIDVRTRTRLDYDLIIRPADPDDRTMVLAIGVPEYPGVKLVGSTAVGEAKKHPEFVRTYGDRPPAWFVPQEFLHQFRVLPTGE